MIYMSQMGHIYIYIYISRRASRFQDSVLNMKLCRCLTYEYLLEDLEKLIRHKNCGPILIRLSWHDAGVFNGAWV